MADKTSGMLNMHIYSPPCVNERLYTGVATGSREKKQKAAKTLEKLEKLLDSDTPGEKGWNGDRAGKVENVGRGAGGCSKS